MRRPGSSPRERRWGSIDRLDERNRPSRALLVALLLACASLITLDYHGGPDSPMEPARRVAGEVFGPIETGAATALRPFVAVPQWFRSHDSMRREIGELEAENARLRSEASTAGYDRNRLEEFDGLTTAAEALGYALVPARDEPARRNRLHTLDEPLSRDRVPVRGLEARVRHFSREPRIAECELPLEGEHVQVPPVGGRPRDLVRFGIFAGCVSCADAQPHSWCQTAADDQHRPRRRVRGFRVEDEAAIRRGGHERRSSIPDVGRCGHLTPQRVRRSDRHARWDARVERRHRDQIAEMRRDRWIRVGPHVEHAEADGRKDVAEIHARRDAAGALVLRGGLVDLARQRVGLG